MAQRSQSSVQMIIVLTSIYFYNIAYEILYLNLNYEYCNNELKGTRPKRSIFCSQALKFDLQTFRRHVRHV